jgi:hypothetical protein
LTGLCGSGSFLWSARIRTSSLRWAAEVCGFASQSRLAAALTVFGAGFCFSDIRFLMREASRVIAVAKGPLTSVQCHTSWHTGVKSKNAPLGAFLLGYLARPEGPPVRSTTRFTSENVSAQSLEQLCDQRLFAPNNHIKSRDCCDSGSPMYWLHANSFLPMTLHYEAQEPSGAISRTPVPFWCRHPVSVQSPARGHGRVRPL